jgi:hypothetical protein
MVKSIFRSILILVIVSFTAFMLPVNAQGNGDYAMISELNDGIIYQIAVAQSGIYKLDNTYFEEQGIDAASIKPSNVQLFGNGGGMLPESIADERIDDLIENPIFFSGDNDDIFEENEYFLFYGEGPDVWKFEADDRSYFFEKKYLRYRELLLSKNKWGEWIEN